MTFANGSQFPSLTALYGKNSGIMPTPVDELGFEQPIPGVRPAVPVSYEATSLPTPDQLAIQRDISLLFCELRSHLGLSQQGLANRLSTDVHMLTALESGHLNRLPQWPETARVVRAYLELVGVEATPVLYALKNAMRRVTPVVAPMPGMPPTLSDRLRAVHAAAFDPRSPTQVGAPLNLSGGATPIPNGPLDGSGLPFDDVSNDINFDGNDTTMAILRERWNGMKSLYEIAQVKKKARSSRSKVPPYRRLIGAGLCSVGLVLAASVTPVWGEMSRKLPVPIGPVMSQIQDFVLLRFASYEDGMPVIELSDPRARKDNKLRSEGQ